MKWLKAQKRDYRIYPQISYRNDFEPLAALINLAYWQSTLMWIFDKKCFEYQIVKFCCHDKF